MSSSGPIVDLTGTPFGAGTTPEWTFQITDANGNPIAASSLFTLTLTIVDTATKAVVNGVQDVNVLNAGRGAVDAQGNVTITLTAADTALLSATDTQEFRSLILFWTWNGGASEGWRQANCLILAPSAT